MYRRHAALAEDVGQDKAARPRVHRPGGLRWAARRVLSVIARLPNSVAAPSILGARPRIGSKCRGPLARTAFIEENGGGVGLHFVARVMYRAISSGFEIGLNKSIYAMG